MGGGKGEIKRRVGRQDRDESEAEAQGGWVGGERREWRMKKREREMRKKWERGRSGRKDGRHSIGGEWKRRGEGEQERGREMGVAKEETLDLLHRPFY